MATKDIENQEQDEGEQTMRYYELKAYYEDNRDSISKIEYDIINLGRGQETDFFKWLILASYVSYFVIENNISSTDELRKEINRIKGYGKELYKEVENSFSEILTISAKYPKDVLLAITLFSDMGMDKMAAVETPDCLYLLASSLLGTHSKDSKLADMNCRTGRGLGQVAICETGEKLYGIGNHKTSNLISKIRMSILADTAEIIESNVFELNSKYKFDGIIADMPNGIKYKPGDIPTDRINDLDTIIPGVKASATMDWLYIANVLYHLKNGGSAAIIVPTGILHNAGTNRNIRESIVKAGVIEAIIGLPDNMYLGTGISQSMIILRKGKKSKQIRVINAKEMAASGRRVNVLTDHSISYIGVYMAGDSPHRSILVEPDEIERKDYNLNPLKYFEKEIIVRDGVPFDTLIEDITRGSQLKADILDEMSSAKETQYQYLMLTHIQDGMISNSLPYLKDIERKLEKYCLKSNNLIISKNGIPVKVAMAQVYDDNKILANGNLYIVRLKEDKVNPIYLKAYLESDEGQEQLKRISVGTAMPNIPIDGLKNIEIPLPSMDEQKRIAREYLELQDDLVEYKERIEETKVRMKAVCQ